jgi:hypothetical protein
MIIWTIEILLALAFAAAGTMKLVRSKSQLEKDPRMGWAQTLSSAQIKGLATLEVLGALGLIVPTATGIAPHLTHVAAACLATLMGGAIATHALRREPAVAPTALAILAIVVATWR